jgi:CRISPR-associated endoribonuclease Cas6
MRVYLKLSSNKTLVDFNYQSRLVGTLHKWIGNNELHGKQSLFSMSWLSGGKALGSKGLEFPNGAQWFISAYDEDLIKKIVSGVMLAPEVSFGMKVADITLRDTPEFNEETRFFLGSPVLVKRNMNEKQRHFTYLEADTDTYLTETIQHKLSLAGLPSDGISVRFDRSDGRAKTKLVTYRGVQNKANYCPVIINGTPQQIGFAWNVGIGNSTGIGFGSLS